MQLAMPRAVISKEGYFTVSSGGIQSGSSQTGGGGSKESMRLRQCS